MCYRILKVYSTIMKYCIASDALIEIIISYTTGREYRRE